MSDYEVYDSCIQEHLFTSLLAEAIDDDGMYLDKGPPRLEALSLSPSSNSVAMTFSPLDLTGYTR